MTVGAEQIFTRLAAALAPSIPGGAGQAPDAPSAGLWVGHVLAINPGAASTYTVTLDGVNPRVGVPALIAPAVGDVVWVLEQPPILLILGTIPRQPGGPFRIGSSQLGSDESLDQP